jgi:rubrerythrin
MERRGFLKLAAGAASLILAACGGGAQSSTAPAPSSAAPAKPSAAAASEAAKPSAAPASSAAAAASALSSAAASSQASPSAKQADVTILNGAIDIEHQAIWTYTAAAGTKLLQKPVLDVALVFKSQHEQHRDALSDAVVKLGGKAVQSKDKYELPDIKTQNDILAFAVKLEDTAAKAYVDAVGKLNDRELAKSAASVAVVEGEHASILREALGQPPVPAAFVA